MAKNFLKKVPYYDQLVQPLHVAKAFHAASRHNYPASAMKVVGVTGTNGKTTTTWMIYNVLREKFGARVGVMSTIGWGFDGQVFDQTAHATTEDPEVLNEHLAKLRDAGVEYLVLEVSSHALAQHRVFGVPFDAAVFTNLSPDHLDYHKTMKKYSAAKQKLFRLANGNRSGKRLGVINGDDAEYENFARRIANPLKYGLSDGDVFAKNVQLAADGVEYDMKFSSSSPLKVREKVHTKTEIPGEFNVSNSLAAAAIGFEYGLNAAEIAAGILATHVPGRMNSVDEGQDFSVIIDFATTPDALQNVMPGIRATTKNRVIALIGLPGQRDQSKAPGMGEVLAKFSDEIVLTEDDARGNVRAQSRKIARGIPQNYGGEVKLIDDRTEAITAAIADARVGDTVVLLGKGPEKIIARKRGAKIVDEAWNEEETARIALKNRANSSKSEPKSAKKSAAKKSKKA